VVCTKGELVLGNAANANALAKLEKDLVNAKQNGAFQNIDYRIQELQEWSVEPTNLEKPAQNSDLPFDANPSSDGIWDNWG
jgi:hypothetical protein